MNAVLRNIDVFANGVAQTLLLAAMAGVIAMALGILLASLRVSSVPTARRLGTLYVGVARNTPLTVVFFFSAFVLPQLGIAISYFSAATIALSLYYAAFFCEALRAGINSVAQGQAEAARAIGLRAYEVLSIVILPQALRSVIPPVTNVCIALLKNTAVAAAFGVPELLSAMENVANREGGSVIPVLIATALFYLMITIPVGLLAARAERRLAFTR